MSTDLTPGSVLGRYELLIQVAQGAIAQVWAARLRGTRGFQKIVAIKTLISNSDTRAFTRALLVDEVRLAALVHHPNVVGTLELGEERGILFIVMEWVHGETLRAVVRASYQYGGLPRNLAVNIIAQACRAIHAAHETRDPNGNSTPLIHRDLSPQNVLIGYTGKVKVSDFGVAKAHQWNADLGGRNEMKRKIAYMSPEQLMANGLDCRSDVFSVGVVLYLITTGQHPFKGSTPEETIQNVCFHDPTRPSLIARDYPTALEGVVLKALAKHPEDRWSSASEMLEALVHAEPAISDRNAEQRIAQFLNNTIGEMGRNRMQLVHHAQQWVDAQSSPTPLSSFTPPIPRRSRRDSAITLNSIAVSESHPPISNAAFAHGPAPIYDTTERLSRPSRVEPVQSPSKRASIRNNPSFEVTSESRPYTPLPLDSSRRSDWGAQVPVRSEARSRVLAWLGAAGVMAVLCLVAVREHRKTATGDAARAETVVAAPAIPESTTLACLPADVPAPPLQAPTVSANDLPKAEATTIVHDVSPKARQETTSSSFATPKRELGAGTNHAPKKVASSTTNNLRTSAQETPSPSTARKVDAWDPSYYGGRN